MVVLKKNIRTRYGTDRAKTTSTVPFRQPGGVPFSRRSVKYGYRQRTPGQARPHILKAGKCTVVRRRAIPSARRNRRCACLPDQPANPRAWSSSSPAPSSSIAPRIVIGVELASSESKTGSEKPRKRIVYFRSGRRRWRHPPGAGGCLTRRGSLHTPA